MYLSALSIGYAVPAENFDATVHSAFHSALNLRLDAEDELLTLVTSGEGDLPQGIRLDTPAGFSFEEFQTGERAVCRDGVLSLENRSLTVQMNGARHWKCDLPALKFDPTIPAASAAWRFVWETLNQRQRRLGSEIVAEELLRSNAPSGKSLLRRVREAMRDLLHATRRCELTSTAAVASLLGLGPGLTPSGDDILVGYMAGLWCTVQESSERAQFIASLGKTILELLDKTNDISRTYLYHAVRGQVSSRLSNLAQGISRGADPELLHEISETAMNVGHTSGMEAVSGLLVGLRAWEGDHLHS